jgi:hypothetical protein
MRNKLSKMLNKLSNNRTHCGAVCAHRRPGSTRLHTRFGPDAVCHGWRAAVVRPGRQYPAATRFKAPHTVRPAVPGVRFDCRGSRRVRVEYTTQTRRCALRLPGQNRGSRRETLRGHARVATLCVVLRVVCSGSRDAARAGFGFGGAEWSRTDTVNG